MSEVTEFRENQARREQSAKWGLTGTANGARHAFINARMGCVWPEIEKKLQQGRDDDAMALFDEHMTELDEDLKRQGFAPGRLINLTGGALLPTENEEAHGHR